MKYLLNISDLTNDDFHNILKYSEDLEINNESILEGKNIGLIFEKNSTRTRISFQVGINQLSGKYVDIKLDELNLQRIESFEDTFKIFSCYLDCIVYRTTDHKKLELALKCFNKPIINALSNYSHPCQSISDIFTLREHFQREDNFKIVWCGDLNNVLLSLLQSIEFLENSQVDIFTNEQIYKENISFFPKSDKISYNFDYNDKILKNADCIMTDVYNSMNDKVDKEPLLKKFQVNDYLMKQTSETSVFMHCLPAKVGSEVTLDVIKSKKSITFKQAKNRMVAQRGILKWLEL